MSIIKNRSELLFLYEIENANPNGDPLNENRPRYDEEESRALVSDVRLKRSIRDYWLEYKGYDGSKDKDIYVRETRYEEGGKSFVSDGKRRAESFKESKEKVLETCIDVRVFGGVLPLKSSSYTFTGPVQFQMGKSLNETEIITEQGTGGFASGDGRSQNTFRTEYKLPYAVIGFNGIINEKAAQHSLMTEEDKLMLKEGIWEGTKNLISRSKFGQQPLLLISIEYKDNYYIGGLRQMLSLNSEKDSQLIRSTKDYKLDMTTVLEAVKNNADKIDHIELRISERLVLSSNGKILNLRSGNYEPNELF